MKKLFLLTVAVIFAFSMNAQRFGARLGGNFSDMKSTVEQQGKKIAPGMQIGLLTELGPKMFAIRVEANFAQKGFNIRDEETFNDVVFETKNNIDFGYIEIPVLAKAKVFGPLYLYAGPYFGFAFSGKSKNEYFIDGVKEDLGEYEKVDLFSEDNQVPYKRTDFGAIGGLGAQFGIGPIHAFAEARATLGLSNLYDTESQAWDDLVAGGGYAEDDKLKNMVWTVAVGILLGK